MNPILPHQTETVSYVGAAPLPPSAKHPDLVPGHGRLTGNHPDGIPVHPSQKKRSDKESREELHAKELEEAQQRVLQMEKTMKWWSDCTTNWREKWSKCRNERNKTKEDYRHLKKKYEKCLSEIEQLKKSSTSSKGSTSELSLTSMEASKEREDNADSQLAGVVQRLKSEEMEKNNLQAKVHAMSIELEVLKAKLDEEIKAKEDIISQFSVKSQTNAVDSISRKFEEDLDIDDSDKRLVQLQLQLERLQKENATEWERRERLETNQLNLERENKKLILELSNAQGELQKMDKNSSKINWDVKKLEQALADKTKEAANLKHFHTKQKKLLNERTSELEHSTRRAEQYEEEVKKLRLRIEELKKEHLESEENVDIMTNELRAVQRQNEQLIDEINVLKIDFANVAQSQRDVGSASDSDSDCIVGSSQDTSTTNDNAKEESAQS